jgi:hypothetical protein
MTREQYLIAASAWKQAYAEHSAGTRDLKQAVNKAQRTYEAGPFQNERISRKAEATAMLEQRHAMKEEAQASFLAERA